MNIHMFNTDTTECTFSEFFSMLEELNNQPQEYQRRILAQGMGILIPLRKSVARHRKVNGGTGCWGGGTYTHILIYNNEYSDGWCSYCLANDGKLGIKPSVSIRTDRRKKFLKRLQRWCSEEV